METTEQKTKEMKKIETLENRVKKLEMLMNNATNRVAKLCKDVRKVKGLRI